jgi:hypothetical protein
MIKIYDGLEKDEIDELIKSAKVGKYIRGKYDENKSIEILPNLISPFIIEVMTASTSGSDKESGTDIASSFTNAILGQEHNCPGINKRQVWGRMATQLFAKSALAESWGGKTIWLVQDQLLKNIELTTRLKFSNTQNSNTSTINFLSMSYNSSSQERGFVSFSAYVEKSAGLNFNGNNDCTDILLPKIYPSKKELLKSILRRELSAIIHL